MFLRFFYSHPLKFALQVCTRTMEFNKDYLDVMMVIENKFMNCLCLSWLSSHMKIMRHTLHIHVGFHVTSHYKSNLNYNE